MDTTLLQLCRTCEVRCEHLVPNKIPNSLLKQHFRSGHLNHLIHVNCAHNSVQFGGQTLGKLALRHVLQDQDF